MSNNILRDYIKDNKKTEGGKYITNRDFSKGLSPSEYGGFLDKKRSKKHK
jgi:hypothetical protein